MEATLSNLEEKKELLRREILSIQSNLGQKVMLDEHGNKLTLEQYTAKRQKLKDACNWRMIEVRKLNLKIKELNREAQPKYNPDKRQNKIIAIAFSLLCNDASKGETFEGMTDKDIANTYMSKADIQFDA